MFFFNASATTLIYTYDHNLSLHDALPISNRFSDGSAGSDRIERVGQDRFDGRLSIAVPIASRDENPHSLLGDLALDFAGGLTFGSRQASRPRFEVGANWSPIPALRINGSASFAKLAPSLEQRSEEHTSELQSLMRTS